MPLKAMIKMLTKYYLHTADTEYELHSDDLLNWADIRCTYKRSNYDGILRSFTSQFEFVNTAYDIIQSLYIRDRFNAIATISIHTANNNWTYEKQYECPLDFSTIEWGNYSCKINCVDNSLAALIKSKKSTKYEFITGTEILIDDTFSFDRLPMQESASYEFTEGTSFDDCGDIVVSFKNKELPWVGLVGNEIVIGKKIYFTDDQDRDDDTRKFCIKAYADMQVRLDYSIGWRSDLSSHSTTIKACVRRDGAYIATAHINGNGVLALVGENDYTYRMYVDNENMLPDASVYAWHDYALVDGIVYVVDYERGSGSRKIWTDTGQTPERFFLREASGSIVFNLRDGDEVVIDHEPADSMPANVRFTYSKFTFGWLVTDDVVNIRVIKPITVVDALVRRIAEQISDRRLIVHISGYDARIDNTYLIAAEDARGITGAKLYTSFDEFAEWMSVVFGYIYTIGEIEKPRYQKRMKFGQIVTTPYELSGKYEGSAEDIDVTNIYYSPIRKQFFYVCNGYWSQWPGCEAYNNPDSNFPMTDTVFCCESNGKCYSFDECDSDSSEHNPTLLDGYTWENVFLDTQRIIFCHRSEMFNDCEPRKIEFCRDLKYGVDSSVIYSSVTAGYEKRDYENVNGRDEFNFNNTYTTGCSVSDKTLSLLSKYRADCYGLEFAVQKRGKDTTDTTSDKDVFFVMATRVDGNLIPDRSINITGTISDKLFNGAFSPMACIRANAGYIGLQADEMLMEFASSVGNSDVFIDGEKMSDNIILNSPFATCGYVEFITDDVEAPADATESIIVENGGVIYQGYLNEVDVKYARQESAKYKLIVKRISPCL